VAAQLMASQEGLHERDFSTLKLGATCCSMRTLACLVKLMDFGMLPQALTKRNGRLGGTWSLNIYNKGVFPLL
jgi:hypothetical protein